MGELAAMAEKHWQTSRPREYAAIPAGKRAAFFLDLETQADEQIQAMADALAGPDRTGESYLDRAGRLTEADQTARAAVIRELILPEPTPDSPGMAEELGGTETEPADPGDAAMAEFEKAVAAFWTAKESLTS